MPDINVLQPVEQQPNRGVLPLGERPQTLTFYLRAYPPPMILQVPGGPSAVSGVVVPPPVSLITQTVVRPGPRSLFIVATPNPLLLPAGLVHARAIGAGPKVNPQLRPTGLSHARAQGNPTVIPPPVIPPVIPPPTPTPATSSPRNLRYVRRRNIPPER